MTERAQRILCIDDDARMRRAVASSLQSLGVEVVQASNADEALAAARDSDFALVLCDYVLEGTDGLELIGRLKAVRPTPAYALMTGVSDINMLAGAVNSRAISFFVLKPWHADELREIVRTALTMTGAGRLATVATPKPASAVAVARQPSRRDQARPWMSAIAAALLLVAPWFGAGMATRQAKTDALALARITANAALTGDAADVTQLARDGVTYVTVSRKDGELLAWGLDRRGMQLPESDRDAALALRETASERIVVAERAASDKRAEVGVALESFESLVQKLRGLAAVCSVIAIVFAVTMWPGSTIDE